MDFYSIDRYILTLMVFKIIANCGNTICDDDYYAILAYGCGVVYHEISSSDQRVLWHETYDRAIDVVGTRYV